MVDPSPQALWSQTLLETLSSLSYREQSLESYLHEITCAVSHLLSIDWSVVTCCDRNEYQVIASNIEVETSKNTFNLHGSLTGTVVETGQILCVGDTAKDSQYGSAPPGYLAYLGIPLKVPNGEVIGTVCCFDAKPRNFSPEALSIVKLLAERAAIAIDNYNLYQKQQDFNQALEEEVAKRTAQLQEAQAKLIEKEKLAAIGQFASMIVHELRNPTTTILMGLTSLEKLELDPRNRKRLSLALEEGQRLKSLLQEILLYAKPQILQAERIELNQFLSEMYFALMEMPQAQQRILKMVNDDFPFAVKGDRDKLKQVIINLVRNAFEAIDEEEVVTCQIKLDADPNYYRISICNRGVPIPAELLPKLTEPFVSNKPDGTGLGLTIVKQIVINHGGALSIESNLEQGTQISFTLPKCG